MFPELRRAIGKLFEGEPVSLGLKGYVPISDTFTSGGGGSQLLLPRTNYNYARAVGDGLGSSVVMSPIRFVQRTFPEAPIELIRKSDEKAIEVHPLLELLAQPNDHYTGDDLWAATLYSRIWEGDGYWLKVREDVAGTPWYLNVAGKLKALYYAPHWCMEPVTLPGSRNFIDVYRYSVGGQSVDIDPRNVVHFRNGLNPRDPRHGLGLQSELREIFTDDEAANYTSTILKNMGVPGVVISPKTGMPMIDAESQEAAKALWQQKTTGDHRGEALVTSGAVDVTQVGFDPKKMMVSEIRDVAEERVCAAIGIPPSVVHFGTGLQQTKVGATMYEDVKLAWTGCIMPTQKACAATIEQSLVWEFEGRPQLFKVRFAWDKVMSLQENQKQKSEWILALVGGGVLRVDRGQQMLGLEVDPTQDIYLRSFNVIEVPAGGAKSRKLLAKGSKATTRQQRDLIARFVKDAVELETAYDTELTGFFNRLAGMVGSAADEYFDAKSRGLQRKDDEDDADAILRDIDMPTLQGELAQINGVHHLNVSKKTATAIKDVIELEVNIPAEREAEIIAAGGKRMGLVDLKKQTRERMLRDIASAREAGEGPVAIARQIRDGVPKGPWSSVQARARTIARTETSHAQRESSLDLYSRTEGVASVMLFDGRLPTSDDDCIERNGDVVSFEDAAAMMAEEHPNGTLQFAPVMA